MGSILDVCDLRGPPGTTLRTPWGSMDPRLRTYALDSRADPIKLFFFANKEFFRFSLVSLCVCYMKQKLIYSKLT